MRIFILGDGELAHEIKNRSKYHTINLFPYRDQFDFLITLRNYDVFINCHYTKDQDEILMKVFRIWRDKDKHIINISSNRGDKIQTELHDYTINKLSSDLAFNQILQLPRSVRLTNIRPGFFDTSFVKKYNESKMTVESVAKRILSVIDDRYEVQRITFEHTGKTLVYRVCLDNEIISYITPEYKKAIDQALYLPEYYNVMTYEPLYTKTPLNKLDIPNYSSNEIICRLRNFHQFAVEYYKKHKLDTDIIWWNLDDNILLDEYERILLNGRESIVRKIRSITT